MDSEPGDPLAPPEGLTAAVSGSAQAQNPGTAVTVVGSRAATSGGFAEEQPHLGAAMRTFADPGSAISTIAVAAWQDSQDRIARLQTRVEALEGVNSTLRNELADARTATGIAQERERGLRQAKTSAKALEIVGGIATGTGLPLVVAGTIPLGIALLLLGSVAVLAGLHLESGGPRS
jgi:hypothetical protein